MALLLRGEDLTIEDLVGVSRKGRSAALSDDPELLARIRRSREIILEAIEAGESIYGVTTAFGGMADIKVPKDSADLLQQNIPWPHKTGAGKRLPKADVRAAMLLRANSLMRGVSGVRIEIIQRLVECLDAGITPHVHELGSIGASGDLVPLAYILAAAVGLDRAFTVDMEGEEMDALTALERAGLPRIELAAKEGLSVMNGTSVMAGIGAHALYDARNLLALSLGAHALYAQGMAASNQSFHPFIQQHKPHPGQVWTAAKMVDLLKGSKLIRDELNGKSMPGKNALEQDRYSLRCLPQFMGPIADGFSAMARSIEIEINSATDNPLIDTEQELTLYCGNFLGQYIGVGMDHLRYYIGLLAKHLDVQIAMLVAPEFNNGLPPSLTGNPERPVNLGLKGLQISGNSIMPLLSFYGNSLADRFPTHAEQFNQNINSQGFGSANLAREAVGLFRQYMAIALLFGVQAVDLRTKKSLDHYDARKALSPMTAELYEAILHVIEVPPSAEKPYVYNDDEQCLDMHIHRIAADIEGEGRIIAPLSAVVESLSRLKDRALF